jgi:Fe-S oxidoreductase
MTNPEFTQHAAQIRDFEQLMVPSGKTPWGKRNVKPAHPVDVVLYLGCNILRTTHLAYEVVGLFQALGVNFVALAGPHFCCGIVHHRAGDIDGATRLSQATAAMFNSFGAKQVVMWCPTCQLRFEEVILKGITPSFPLIHATAFLAERARQLSFHRSLPARVALHSHVGKSQRELDGSAAVRVLQAVPGVEVVGTLSSPDLDYQCFLPQLIQLGPEGFGAIRSDLLRKARELGADTLTTIYHSCHREWCEVGGTGLVVRNYISIVAEAVGCSRRDDFQEFKKLGDPDAIAALSRPVWETHGLTKTQAKELAAKYFMPKKG